MTTQEQVAEVIREETGFRGLLTDTTSLQADIGVFGDDLSELLNRYAAKFRVEMSGYLWYFHTGEEGCNPLWAIIPPPNARVQEIPITLGMLTDFARLGRWSVHYPEHRTPTWRPDRWVFFMVVGLLSVLLLLLIIVAPAAGG